MGQAMRKAGDWQGGGGGACREERMGRESLRLGRAANRLPGPDREKNRSIPHKRLLSPRWRTRRHARRVRKPCAARFSISHFRGDAGRGSQPLPISSAAAACTPRGAAASRFRYHVPPVRFAHRNMMFPSLQGCSQPCSERPSTCRRSEALRSKVSLHVSPAAPQAQGKRVLAEKAGYAGLFRQAKRAAEAALIAECLRRGTPSDRSGS